ncbi:GrpB family protein [Lacticaseibacillus jixiensis]|uniref:GrpB family protein n=1 Tax=Lacticaseibacillus jixiensis TaxID=3231926 RepID=UPI0036F2C0BB
MKKLEEMSLQELWQLFPIILKTPDPNYAAWYQEERAALLQVLQGVQITCISHIGSTAVPGLLAKPIVDILLELPADYDRRTVIARLQHARWRLMNQNQAAATLDFNKGYTPAGFADRVFRLHVRPAGDWGELYFRDYLIAHPEIASQYASLKRRLMAEYEHDRDAYTAGKTAFVAKYTQLGRQAFGHRYQPKRWLEFVEILKLLPAGLLLSARRSICF